MQNSFQVLAEEPNKDRVEEGGQVTSLSTTMKRTEPSLDVGKGVRKRITPIAIENEVGKGISKDKRKKPAGKLDVGNIGRRKESALHIQ